MQIKRLPKGDGLIFSLDPIDFKKCHWKAFLEDIRNLAGGIYDGETKEWWVSEDYILDFMRIKKQFIDDVMNKDQNEFNFT